jgi:hypothetical protein
MKFYTVVCLLGISLLSGCNSVIEDFVKNGPKRDTESAPATVMFGSKPGYKISPGANLTKGSAVSAQFAITPTQREVKGSSVKATFSIQAHSNQ